MPYIIITIAAILLEWLLVELLRALYHNPDWPMLKALIAILLFLVPGAYFKFIGMLMMYSSGKWAWKDMNKDLVKRHDR